MNSQVGQSSEPQATPKVVHVGFQPAGKLEAFLCGPLALKRGARVVVETQRGPRLGTVAAEPCPAAPGLDPGSLRPVLREAEPRDLEAEARNLARSAEVRRLCFDRIRCYGLPIKLVDVELSHDGRRATVFFAGEQRCDCRELGRELANVLRLRVETIQVGARDEAKQLGAISPCGRELCCSSWLRDFEPVTIKLAREQGLALNPPKLAGMCGRLKCCLRYEYATYLELRKSLPAAGKRVDTLKGAGKVVRQEILKQAVLVQGDNGGMFEVELAELVAERPH